MCTQVSVTAAFKNCGKKEVRYLPTLSTSSILKTYGTEMIDRV